MKESLEDVYREMVKLINSVHAKLDVIASANESSDAADISLRSIRKLS